MFFYGYGSCHYYKAIPDHSLFVGWSSFDAINSKLEWFIPYLILLTGSSLRRNCLYYPNTYKMRPPSLTRVTLFVTLFLVCGVLTEDLTLTKTQKQKLEKVTKTEAGKYHDQIIINYNNKKLNFQFKEALKSVKSPHPWMKEDLNLVRYLRGESLVNYSWFAKCEKFANIVALLAARVWDVQRAKTMFMEVTNKPRTKYNHFSKTMP